MCREMKPFTDFVRNKKCHEGVTGWCLACSHSRDHERRMGIKNLPKVEVREKECGTCKETKPRTAFGKSSQDRDGLRRTCRACRSIIDARPRMTSVRARIAHLRRYGMTPADFDMMFESQGKSCGVCSQPTARPCIDHSHKTGVVRGLVCYRCNNVIAALEQADIADKAMEYLARHAEPENQTRFIADKAFVDRIKAYKARNRSHETPLSMST